MQGAIEAAGDAATGAMWSRTAEPLAGEGGHGAGGDLCLNCGTKLLDRYCHACGQSAHVHRTLASIGHDLLHGVFHFEGKIWRTIPMLVLHPGALTRRYVAGERARFVSPLALFLFVVFLMFAVFSWLGPSDVGKGFAEGWKRSGSSLEQAQDAVRVKIARLERQRADVAASGQSVAAIDGQIAEQRNGLNSLEQIRHRIEVSPTGDTINVHSRIDWLNRALEKAKENPGLVIYKVQSAAYKFSWALIILSTPFVALLFLWRRRFGLYDHATFVTFSISFMSLLVIVLQVLSAIGAPKLLVEPLGLFAPPAHMFAQLRGAYGLRVFSALWRTVFLLLFAMFALVLFVVGVIVLEVMH